MAGLYYVPVLLGCQPDKAFVVDQGLRHGTSLIQSVEAAPDAFGIWYRSRSWSWSGSGSGSWSGRWSGSWSWSWRWRSRWISSHEFCCAADERSTYSAGYEDSSILK